jgi:hypothetical protein
VYRSCLLLLLLLLRSLEYDAAAYATLQEMQKRNEVSIAWNMEHGFEGTSETSNRYSNVHMMDTDRSAWMDTQTDRRWTVVETVATEFHSCAVVGSYFVFVSSEIRFPPKV